MSLKKTLMCLAIGFSAVSFGVAWGAGGQTAGCVRYVTLNPPNPNGEPCNGSYQQWQSIIDGGCRDQQNLVERCTETPQSLQVLKMTWVFVTGQGCVWRVVQDEDGNDVSKDIPAKDCTNA